MARYIQFAKEVRKSMARFKLTGDQPSEFLLSSLWLSIAHRFLFLRLVVTPICVIWRIFAFASSAKWTPRFSAVRAHIRFKYLIHFFFIFSATFAVASERKRAFSSMPGGLRSMALRIISMRWAREISFSHRRSTASTAFIFKTITMSTNVFQIGACNAISLCTLSENKREPKILFSGPISRSLCRRRHLHST